MQANLSMALPPDYIRDRGVVGPTAPDNIAVKPAPPTKNAPRGFAGVVYRAGGGRGRGLGVYQQNYGSTAGLPTVDDPDKTYAQITRNEYLDYVENYRDFEEQLIEQAQNDTSLIDQAREDITVAQGIAKGVSDRNRQRYGASLTPAQLQQRDARLQRANTLGGIQAVNDARIAQREANTRLLGDLINIGQGVNRSSLDQMGSAAADATQRKNAYQAAKAQSKAQTYSTIGSLGAMAIMAFAF
jgi:hypothetical protein